MTRQKTQQNEFEKSLIDALKSSKIAEAICDAVINTLTKEFSQKFNYYDAKIKSLEAELELLKSTKNTPENLLVETENNKKLEHKVDSLQQQSKNNNIRVIGLTETDNENTITRVRELFTSKMKMSDVECQPLLAFRVGKQSNGNPRHVIVTFSNVHSKNIIYRKKTMLKGSGIVIKEDLTSERVKMVKAASEKHGFRNVWTCNGSIFVKTENGVEKILQ